MMILIPMLNNSNKDRQKGKILEYNTLMMWNFRMENQNEKTKYCFKARPFEI